LESSENIPLESGENIPLGLVEQSFITRRRYTKSEEINHLAINHYRRTGNGITFKDLLSSGLSHHKEQARTTIKHCIEKEVLFAPRKLRPQQYYPVCLKSEVMKRIMSKSIPIDPTGITHSSASLSNHPESTIIQTLEGYILPLLPTAPLHIHNMHFKLTIRPECYTELKLKQWEKNNGKYLSEIIGTTGITYVFYHNGTVEVYTKSSNNPHKVESEYDRSRLLIFFGQVRDRLITFLADIHERIVPDIMEWELTQCDINKDIVMSDWLQFTGLKIHVRHLDHLFRIYIKSMGKDTVCRVEETKHPKKNKPVIEAINDIFNPNEKIENEITK
jgi:hypothetical protein